MRYAMAICFVVGATGAVLAGLSGCPKVPILDIEDATLLFDCGETASKVFTITNTGGGSPSVSFEEDVDWLVINPSRVTLEKDESKEVGASVVWGSIDWTRITGDARAVITLVVDKEAAAQEEVRIVAGRCEIVPDVVTLESDTESLSFACNNTLSQTVQLSTTANIDVERNKEWLRVTTVVNDTNTGFVLTVSVDWGDPIVGGAEDAQGTITVSSDEEDVDDIEILVTAEACQ